MNQGSRVSIGMVAALAGIAVTLLGGVMSIARTEPAVVRPAFSRPAPAVGVDLIYYSTPPFVLIEAFNDPAKGREAGTALRELAGVTAVRFSSHGLWSVLGPEATLAVRREVKLPNFFPWFPAESLVDWVVSERMTIVLGINPEEGPAAAVELVRAFERRGALDRIVAVELGNEPHLNLRPWQPEEYAEAAAEIVRALEPYGLDFAIPLTLGPESKTPTGLSDDEYTRRQMAVLAERLSLASRDDIYGVVHLYSRGVDPRTIDALNELVHPYAPGLRYLITEYNIRSTLEENQHLTTPYALEFVKRVSRLVAHPDVAGLFVHGVPYHSLLYWSGRNVVTTYGLADRRLDASERTPGWHATPVGQIHALFARHVWRGELLAFADEGDVQGWIVRSPEGELRAALLNTSDRPVSRRFAIGGTEVEIRLPSRAAAVSSGDGEIARVHLHREW